VAGQDEVGVELGERLEREAPLVQARVRHAQAGGVDRLVAVEQQVEVDRARAEARARSLAAQGLLDGEQPIQELARRERRLELGRAVQEARLVQVADGVGLPEGGDGAELDAGLGCEEVERPAERRLPVAEVRAQADEGARQRRRSTVAAACSTGSRTSGLRTRTRTRDTGKRSRSASAAAAASASSR